MHAKAALRARKVVGECNFTTHPYLERKGFPDMEWFVHEEGFTDIKFDPDLVPPILCVPMNDAKRPTDVPPAYRR